MKNVRTIERPDGAEWQSFELDHCDVMLTSRGRELMEERPELENTIHLYLQKALGKTMLEGAGVRQFFAEGSNSRVYTVAEDLLMKETHAHSMYDSLERMDMITMAIEKGHVPRWIDLPYHYGMFSSPRLQDEFVLMQRVDGGVNVGHILHPEDSSELERVGVERRFGPVNDQVKEEVAARYADCEQILHQAIADQGLIPHDLLTDWHEGNVLVERLTTPVGGSPYKMWVIDQ